MYAGPHVVRELGGESHHIADVIGGGAEAIIKILFVLRKGHLLCVHHLVVPAKSLLIGGIIIKVGDLYVNDVMCLSPLMIRTWSVEEMGIFPRDVRSGVEGPCSRRLAKLCSPKHILGAGRATTRLLHLILVSSPASPAHPDKGLRRSGNTE